MAKHPDTEMLHAAEGARSGAKPLTTPIYATTTFVFDNAAEVEAYQRGRHNSYLYTRYSNPNIDAVEEKVALLEQGEAALLTSSGMAATATALFGLLKAGDEIVCSAAIYGGTLHLITDYLRGFGVTSRFASLEQFGRPQSVLGPTTRVVWFESPINPTLRCIDIAKVASACRTAGVISIVDNTFASPLNQQPLTLGVDLVMHSATKYLNGHSDVTAGVLVGGKALIDQLQLARRLFGGVLEPASAYALSRGMKTLGLRVARQNASAMQLAEWLSTRKGIAQVFYPGLRSHPDHDIAKCQMRGFGGMVTFDVAGGYEAACRVYDRLQVVQRAASLGGVESICSLPILTSQYGFTDQQLAEAGVSRGMIRLSVGLEDPGDLISDLDQSIG